MSSRRVSTEYNLDNDIVLEVTTSHDKESKVYRTSVWRAHQDGMFRSVSIMEDSYREIARSESVARFSQKNMEELHYAYVSEVIEPNLAGLKEWAAQKKIK